MRIYKRVSLWLSMGIMAIGLITFYISAPAEANSPSTSASDKTPGTSATASVSASPTPSPSPSPTPEPTPTPIPNDLEKNAYPAINELIERYLNAKLECSVEAFEDIVSDTTYLNLEDIQRQTESITAYSDINCYTKRGTGNIDYTAYFTYNMNMVTISTPIFGFSRLYITHAEDGTYRIFLGELDPEVQTYLDELEKDDDFVAIQDESFAIFMNQVSSDEDLAAFWSRYYALDTTDEELPVIEPETASGTAAEAEPVSGAAAETP